MVQENLLTVEITEHNHGFHQETNLLASNWQIPPNPRCLVCSPGTPSMSPVVPTSRDQSIPDVLVSAGRRLPSPHLSFRESERKETQPCWCWGGRASQREVGGQRSKYERNFFFVCGDKSCSEKGGAKSYQSVNGGEVRGLIRSCFRLQLRQETRKAHLSERALGRLGQNQFLHQSIVGHLSINISRTYPPPRWSMIDVVCRLPNTWTFMRLL